jgi:hypothetical protein
LESHFFTYLMISYRNKVDLTKYIEEHNFNFDNVFDEEADNQLVKLIFVILVLDILSLCLTISSMYFLRS